MTGPLANEPILPRWLAVDTWVAEENPVQRQEPHPLFRCDDALNASQVVWAHNALVDSLQSLRNAVRKIVAEVTVTHEAKGEPVPQWAVTLRNAAGGAR